MSKKLKNRGFTLIELMVTISIISLITSIVLASLTSAKERARIVRVESDKHQAELALELYYEQFGGYPYAEGADKRFCISAEGAPPCLYLDQEVHRRIQTIDTISSIPQFQTEDLLAAAKQPFPKFKNDITIKVGEFENRGVIYISCETFVTIDGVKVCGFAESGPSAAQLVYLAKTNTGELTVYSEAVGSDFEGVYDGEEEGGGDIDSGGSGSDSGGSGGGSDSGGSGSDSGGSGGGSDSGGSGSDSGGSGGGSDSGGSGSDSGGSGGGSDSGGSGSDSGGSGGGSDSGGSGSDSGGSGGGSDSGGSGSDSGGSGGGSDSGGSGSDSGGSGGGSDSWIQ